MPELPEVETTLQGILPHVRDRKVARVIVRQPALRWPVSPALGEDLPGQRFRTIERRGKYLLLGTAVGTLVIHLGMSGSLRVLSAPAMVGRHDHVDIELSDQSLLRFTDPRRFGCLLWVTGDVHAHPLLRQLGPEPLTDLFSGDHLWHRSRGRKAPVKTFVMDSHIVVGVGNIYANEGLYLAGIHPRRQAGRIGRIRYLALADAIRTVLGRAIAAGGTTLRDFTDSNGNPGYFKQSLNVYGRAGASCNGCGAILKEIRLGGRSTVYCPRCQT